MPSARVNDVELYYEIHGDGPGEPAVLVMGLGVSLLAWERVLPALAAERRVLVLDNRGVGRSEKPRGPYTTEGLADDVAALMDEVGFRRAHVVGISLGGMIAQQLALGHARRVRSLALLVTYARAEAETLHTAEEGAEKASGLHGNLGTMLKALEQGSAEIDPRLVMGYLMPLIFTPDYMKREKAALKEFFERSLALGFSTRGFAGQLAAAMKHDTAARLGTIGAPTLVVGGSADRLVPPRHSHALARLILGARLVELAGAPHGLTFERADELNRLLVGWLAEHDPRP